MKLSYIFVLISLFIFVCYSANSQVMCDDNLDPGTSCRMITPSINCTTYNYTIINPLGTILESGDLALLNNSIYYFNFSQGTGYYVIKLCDSTTREVYVQYDSTEDKMTDIAIIIGLVGFAFWLIYTAGTLNVKNDAGQVIYLNSLIKTICYAGASFIAYITIQLSYSFASVRSYHQGILDQLMASQNLIMWLGIIILLIIVFGVFGNLAYNIAKNAGTWIKGRRR